MSQRGRGAKATAGQRAEVERLAAEGVSVRRIAAQVFGDVGYRGRVERILQRPATAGVGPEPVAPQLEDVDFSRLGTTAFTRLLLERRLAAWAASGKAPSIGELRTLLDVQRRLEAFETVERLRPRQKDETGSE